MLDHSKPSFFRTSNSQIIPDFCVSIACQPLQSIAPTKTHPAAHPSSVQHRPAIPGISVPDRQGYPNSPGGIDPRSPGPTAVATPQALATGDVLTKKSLVQISPIILMSMENII